MKNKPHLKLKELNKRNTCIHEAKLPSHYQPNPCLNFQAWLSSTHLKYVAKTFHFLLPTTC